MKVRREEDANEKLGTNTCSNVVSAACALKATEPSGAMSRWLTRREHLLNTGLRPAVRALSVVSNSQRRSG